MATAFRPRTIVLFAGDILFFILALWLSLYVRVLEVPSTYTFIAHLTPFSLLFDAWVVVYFIAGLYESRSILLARRALSATLLIAQTINVTLAALFFFVMPLPIFGIAPKTLLFIYLIVSFVLVLIWRVFIFPALGLSRPEPAVVVGESKEISDLIRAMHAAHKAPVRIVETVNPASPDLGAMIVSTMERHEARVVIADFTDPRVAAAFPHTYKLLAAGARFYDALATYEELFGRIPLSLLDDRWLARNVSRYSHLFYDSIKRGTDIAVALVGLIPFALIYPFVALALKLQDGGAVVISMPRVGEGGTVFNIYKFRSMSGNDQGAYGANGKSALVVTRVGHFLRTTRLDELPQVLNLLKGNLSCIGPRPETPSLVEIYTKEIPYYGVRHIIKPGLSGWAQLYHHQDPHHGTDIQETRNKLSYDLYYLKHRSLLLDSTVLLKTIRRVLLRGNA
ncbi:sugar transferase [Candidatus Nomurabacteria bacterium]|nr:sugar transferase [Candidatus Nomurabacteria bacterium]